MKYTVNYSLAGLLSGVLLPVMLVACSKSTDLSSNVTSDAYFPPLTFSADVPKGFTWAEDDEKRRDLRTRRRYADWFARLGEESVYEACQPDTEVFRASWFPSFDAPVSSRITNTEGEVYIAGKRLSSPPYEVPDVRTYESTSQLISPDEWEDIIDRIRISGFWQEPNVIARYRVVNDSTLSVRVGGNDGARWILEGCISGEYHIIDRWSGDVDVRLRDIFERLLHLASMEKHIDQLY